MLIIKQEIAVIINKSSNTASVTTDLFIMQDFRKGGFLTMIKLFPKTQICPNYPMYKITL